MKGRQEWDTTGFDKLLHQIKINQNNNKKQNRWNRLKWSEGGCLCQTWAKQLLNIFQTCPLNTWGVLEHHLSDRCFQTWCVEKQIIQVLFKYFNHLKLVQLIFFSPGLVALLADMTGCCCGVGQWRTMKKLTTPSGPVSGSSHIPELEDTWR